MIRVAVLVTAVGALSLAYGAGAFAPLPWEAIMPAVVLALVITCGVIQSLTPCGIRKARVD